MEIPRYKDLTSKLLFTALLILSFLTFSGVANRSQTNPGEQQTTLIAASNLDLTKSINYKRALIRIQPKYLPHVSVAEADHQYTHQVKIRIQELRNTVLPSQTGLFYKVKTIPQSPCDPAGYLVG